jgi:hypothetical protein
MTTFNNSRWKVEETEKNNQWTEVVSKKKQHYTEGRDPFAGMNTSIDYEQEIERLKQLVPKHQQPKKSTKGQHYIPTTTNIHSPHTIYHHHTISRSNSPDTSSDSDTSSLSDQFVTEQEKLRFLAFVRNWTGDAQKSSLEEFYSSSNSLWADQSPWNRSINSYTYFQQPIINNQEGQSPIGMGRRNRH